MTIFYIVIAFVAGMFFMRYRYKIWNSLYYGYYSVLGYCIVRPKMRYMERYLRKKGWYNPILKSKNPDQPGNWSSPDIWSHKDDKNPPYNELGYSLYGAYLRAQGRDINGKKIMKQQ